MMKGYPSYSFFTVFLLMLLITSMNPALTMAQKMMDLPPKDVIEAAPEWAQLMYETAPNVGIVDMLYKQYYENNEYVKNYHTQYYKKWRRIVEPYIDNMGYVLMPDFEEKQAKEKAYAGKIKKLKKEQKSANRNNVWSCIGPMDTYHTANDGNPQIPVSWQVNVYTIDQSISNPDILFCGTEGGGIFKSTDKAATWNLVGGDLSILTVSVVKIDPTNANIVFAYSDSKIYRTTNGGLTWQVVYTEDNLRLNEILVSPSNNQIIIAAGYGGLLRSTDGGNTWTKSYTDHCWDLKFKTDDASVVFLLKKNTLENRCEFFKSTDSGANFTKKTNGWYNSTDPDRNDGGARMAVSDANSNRVYAFLGGQAKAGDNGFIGVYRSNDAGETWTLPSGQVGGPYNDNHWNLMGSAPPDGYTQGFYDMDMEVSDTDADDIVVAGVGLYRSTDGGLNFEYIGPYGGSTGWVHPDIQEIEINGGDMWLATDGGIDYSTDLFTTIESKKYGITASDFWGFDTGWNEDVYVGGRYHNGNTAMREGYVASLRMGGAEQATGYVNKGKNTLTYFSDIGGGKVIPTNFTGMVKSFAVSKMPNESYYATHSSEFVNDPRYWQTFYLGKDNQVWKTIDGGATFVELGTMGNNSGHTIGSLVIARSNPNVIYCHQRRNSSNDGLFWVTTDGGNNWTNKPYPLAARTRLATLAVSPTDENTIWAGFNGVWNTGDPMIYKSIDGGNTWTDLTTSTLNGENINYIIHQDGTEGGIYLGTNQTVYYKNDNMTDWELYATGLPFKVSTNRLRPFYRDEKIKMGSYSRGVWEAPLYEPSTAIAQPMVEKPVYSCTGDTVFFSDYSILKHAGATWAWDFPGASFVSATDVYNPYVLYDTPGLYSATLTITDANNNTSSKTLTDVITINDECVLDTIPAKALECFADGDFVQTKGLSVTTNTFTMMAWVKPDGIQNDYSAIVMNDDVTVGFNFREGNNTLGYHHPDGQWWWDSNLIVPADEWSHLAFVIKPTGITLYLNGNPATHTLTVNPQVLATMKIGSYKNWNGRNFNGLIDEVSLWDRALTTQEIREKMHHTLTDNETGLLQYFQFNEVAGSEVLDKAMGLHASLVGNADRSVSTAPFGIGLSETHTEQNGLIYFNDANISTFFTAQSGANVTASEIRLDPYNHSGIPTTENIMNMQYYVITRYDNSGVATANLSFTTDEPFNNYDVNNPTNVKLYHRSKTSDGAWTFLKSASNVNLSLNSASFPAVNVFEQFLLTREYVCELEATGDITDVKCKDGNDGSINVSVTGGSELTFNWSNGENTEDISGLSTGTYTLTVTDNNSCTAVYSAMVNEPEALSISENISHNICFGEANGSIELTVSGGTGNYTYAWSNGGTSALIQNLVAGNYDLTLTDDNSCLITASYTITEPADIDISAEITPVTAGETDNGAIDITPSGGTGTTYTYSWSNGETTQDVSGLIMGDYVVTVKDEANCLKVASYNVPQATAVLVKIKVLLEGAYQTQAGLMNTILQEKNLIPAQQPYNSAPWNYYGSESMSVFPADITDWVLIEARSAADPDVVLETQAALLRNDGRIFSKEDWENDASLTEGVYFHQLEDNQSYYFVIRHRNQLDIISNSTMSVNNTVIHDFTNVENIMDGNNQVKEVATGIFAMSAGDVNGDGVITVIDFNLYKVNASFLGQYLSSDINLDAAVTVTDFNLYKPNASLIGVGYIRY